jgi:hypothetical protein
MCIVELIAFMGEFSLASTSALGSANCEVVVSIERLSEPTNVAFLVFAPVARPLPEALIGKQKDWVICFGIDVLMIE